jgi:hypothetical protein
VFEHQFIKWLKDNSEAWVLLVNFDKGKLPSTRQLAAARLIVYVHESHNRAPMQAAATRLAAWFTPGEAFNFSQLGPTVGWTVVQRGHGPGDLFVPPKRYAIDVTRAVRGWPREEPMHGLGLRIQPNRGVDDGWTVRFTPAREKPAELEIDVYTDE